jgi:carbonic anhydrase
MDSPQDDYQADKTAPLDKTQQPLTFAQIEAANAEYAEHFALRGFDGVARRGIAVVTCMDSRIDPLQTLGLRPGDAKIFRNPGGRVTDAALEALVLASHLLGVQRVVIMPHTRCAVTGTTEDALRQRISERAGKDASWMSFHVVADQVAALKADVHKVTSHPLIAAGTEVAGYLYDVDTGLIQRMV